jgi:DNA-nicking Smr family endonuclease
VSRRPRQLSREERELWALVARATVPLKGRALPPAPEAPPAPAPASAQPASAPAKTVPAAKPALSPLVPLERRVTRALAQGRKQADSVIDLHGMTQAEAHGALVRFLHRAQAAGHGLVLVVTGKGSGQHPDGFMDERGVLRRMVPHWLTRPDLRPLVLGFDEAGPRQGGHGALYVRLRRIRPRG